MSSSLDRDEIIDYIEDTSHNEDETLFLPAPEGRPDSWSVFYIGMLTGVAGGGLIPLGLWLGALLIFLGYGASMFSFGMPRTRFGRALRYGFAVASLFGGILFGGTVLFPVTVDRLMEIAMKRHLVFLSVAALPWAIAVVRYCYTLFSPPRVRKRQPA